MPRPASSSDLTDARRAANAPMIPDAPPPGRPRKADKREIEEAILYVPWAGCAWRPPPHDFPPSRTVIAAGAAGGGSARGSGVPLCARLDERRNNLATSLCFGL